MKILLVLSIPFFCLNLFAQETSEQLKCFEHALPEDSRLDKFLTNNSKISSAYCNQEVTKFAIRKLTNAHLCRDLKIDPNMSSKVKRKINCDSILAPIKTPAACEPFLEDEAKNLLDIHARLAKLEPDSSPQQLHDDLLSIYLNRLVMDGERAPGRGATRAFITNNLPSIAFGVIYENTDVQLSKKTNYLVCIEQVYRFIDSETPEAAYLMLKGYTLDLYDETPKSDDGDKVTHAYTQLTSPDGKKYVFDSWKGLTKDFGSEEISKDSKGPRTYLRRSPLKSY